MKKIPQQILDHIKPMSTKDAFNSLVEDMGFSHGEAAQILDVYIFEDISFQPHRVVKNGVQANFYFPNPDGGDDIWISIVGGGDGLYGDGKDTFEVWGSTMDDPIGWLTHDQVTQELLKVQ